MALHMPVKISELFGLIRFGILGSSFFPFRAFGGELRTFISDAAYMTW